jgi:SSS family solute:Na+ symporter
VLGSAIFLVLRLLWMAIIVYATSDAVLKPLLGLDDSTTPWICVVVSLITVAYTSMGGLQAVVFTDVVQTAIMFMGAILSLVLITVNLGGVAAWWPQSWSPQWDEPSFFFAPESRVSLGMSVLATFVWYVSTAGSDQMAIQRYLATRDAAAARKMFGISLICNAIVNLLLAGLGLALFSYYSAHSELLGEGETIASVADQLLPRFIVHVLPSGISGLVVAGILSAAMDSLSSGLNSASSVITADWIDRYRRQELPKLQQLRQAKIVTWGLGITVMGVSLFANYVSGNLLEVTYKVVNLLAAPLFVMFFMAMFVPWATTPGTWAAVITSTIAAVLVAYRPDLGLGFLWVMPVSLAVGVIVGCLASLGPFGRRRPMLELGE